MNTNLIGIYSLSLSAMGTEDQYTDLQILLLSAYYLLVNRQDEPNSTFH